MKDGWYFFREDEFRYWRAARVEDGLVWGRWSAIGAPAKSLVGMWDGPISDPVNDARLQKAWRDKTGRLL